MDGLRECRVAVARLRAELDEGLRPGHVYDPERKRDMRHPAGRRNEANWIEECSGPDEMRLERHTRHGVEEDTPAVTVPG